jgi:hypothetical protein
LKNRLIAVFFCPYIMASLQIQGLRALRAIIGQL